MSASSPFSSSPSLRSSSVTASTRNSHKIYSRRTRSRMTRSDLGAEQQLSSDTEGTDDGSPTQKRTKKRPRLKAASSSSEPPRLADAAPDVQAQGQAEIDNEAHTQSSSKARATSPPSTPTRAAQRSKTRTPVSSPRNLSALFPGSGAASPTSDTLARPDSPFNSPARRGGFGLRKMLTKAQSLADNFGSPTRSPSDQASLFGQGSKPITPSRMPGKTQSLPHSPSTDIFSSPRSEGLSMVSGDTGRDENSTPGKPRRTYGRARQVVEVTQDSDDTMVGGDLDAQPHQSYAELRKRFAIDNSVPETSSGSGNLMSEFLSARAPQPVTDMRSKGENRRFLDEISYLTEGIARPSATSAVKRSSSIDILKNMQDESWASKVYLCGQSEKLWYTFLAARGDGDEILDAVCLLFLVILEQTDGELKSILQSSSRRCSDILLGEISKKGQPLDQKDAGKGPASRLARIYSALKATGEIKATTSRGLASHLLNACLQPSLWQIVKDDFPSDLAIISILKAIRLEIDPIVKRLGLYEKGLELVRETDDFDIGHLRSCLGMFSSLPLLSAGAIRLDALPKDTASLFVDTIQLCSSAVQAEIGSSLTARYCVVEALQALAMVANLSKGWAPHTFKAWEAYPLALVIVHRERLAAEQGEDTCSTSAKTSERGETVDQSPQLPSSEDILCSALSILASALKEEEAVAHQLAKISLTKNCIGRRECALQCHCPDASPFSVHLAEIFRHYDEAEIESSGIICGYLALILVSLLGAMPELRRETLAALPGSSDKDRYERVSDRLKSLESMLGEAAIPTTGNSDEASAAGSEEGELAVLSRAVQTVEGLLSSV